MNLVELMKIRNYRRDKWKKLQSQPDNEEMRQFQTSRREGLHIHQTLLCVLGVNPETNKKNSQTNKKNCIKNMYLDKKTRVLSSETYKNGMTAPLVNPTPEKYCCTDPLEPT